MRTSAFLPVALILLVAGCASQKPDYGGAPPSPELLNKQLTQSWDKLNSLEGQLTFRVKNSQFTGSLFGTLKLRPPDQLSLSLKAPFGIPVGDLTISDGRYEAYFSSGQVETGLVEEFDLEEMTGIPLPATDLLRVFEPLARPVWQSDSSTSTESFQIAGPDSLWDWRLFETTLEHQILYNPVNGLVEEEAWRERANNALILRKQYLEPKRISGLLLAHTLELKGGGGYPTEVRVAFETLELNPEWTSNPFQLKANDS